MKELKIFGSVFLLTPIISIITLTGFFYFKFIFFPEKPSIGGGFGGVDFFPTPNINSTGGYIFIFSLIGGTITGIVFSILSSILSGIFLTVIVLWGNMKLPIWSIFIFSLLTGGIGFSYFYFGEDSVKNMGGEGIYLLISSFVCGGIIGFLPLIIVKKFFNL